MSRRRIDPTLGADAVRAWQSGVTDPSTVATAVRFTLEELASRAPGRSLEVRVPPFGVTQCIAGTTHTRGTPPGVVETDPHTWLLLATGALDWQAAVTSGVLAASGSRASLSHLLPLIALLPGRAQDGHDSITEM
jgi:hypothetical protein